MTKFRKGERQILIDALWDGAIGEVEFFECALESGMTMDEIGEALAEVRAEDGVS